MRNLRNVAKALFTKEDNQRIQSIADRAETNTEILEDEIIVRALNINGIVGNDCKLDYILRSEDETIITVLKETNMAKVMEGMGY